MESCKCRLCQPTFYILYFGFLVLAHVRQAVLLLGSNIFSLTTHVFSYSLKKHMLKMAVSARAGTAQLIRCSCHVIYLEEDEFGSGVWV